MAGVWNDGFIYAGNLAYLSLLTLFPFFIVLATIAGAFGRTEDGLHAVNMFLRTLPPDVAKLLAKPVGDVLGQRTGGLLTFGILVGLWTVASFIETVREIIRRAYHASAGRAIWQYRLGSIALIIGSVILILIALSAQVVISGIESFVYRILPWADDVLGLISLSRWAPALALLAALYFLFYTLTPQRYRRNCPKLPGALVTTMVWMATTTLMPRVISSLGSYDLTYGSLAGVMIALLFFFIVGLGLVIGAQLNAALATTPQFSLKGSAQAARNEQGV